MMLSRLLTHLILVSSLLYGAACATIIVTTTPTGSLRCFGNFISNGFRCLPCMNGEIALNNKCVKLALPGYANNLNILQSPIITLINCVQVSQQNSANCAECKKGYDVIAGRCVAQSCRMYSQVTNQCLDNMKESELQTAVVQNTNNTSGDKTAQQIFIVGGPMSKFEIIAADNAIALGLPTFALVYSPKQLQKTDIFTETQQIKVKQLPITITVGCSIYNQKKCIKCYDGYILNLLSSECILISPSIHLPQNQPNPNRL